MKWYHATYLHFIILGGGLIISMTSGVLFRPFTSYLTAATIAMSGMVITFIIWGIWEKEAKKFFGI